MILFELSELNLVNMVFCTFQEVTGKSVMLLPMGAADDGAHSQNEKIDVRNYIEGTKVLAAYLYHVSATE